MRLGKLIQETCPKLWEQLRTLREQDEKIDDELSKIIIIQDDINKVTLYNNLKVTIQYSVKVLNTNDNEIVIIPINNIYASKVIKRK